MSGKPAAGICTGVQLAGTITPISTVGVVSKKSVGQVKVNCKVETEITTFAVPNGG